LRIRGQGVAVGKSGGGGSLRWRRKIKKKIPCATEGTPPVVARWGPRTWDTAVGEIIKIVAAGRLLHFAQKGRRIKRSWAQQRQQGTESISKKSAKR